MWSGLLVACGAKTTCGCSAIGSSNGNSSMLRTMGWQHGGSRGGNHSRMLRTLGWQHGGGIRVVAAARVGGNHRRISSLLLQVTCAVTPRAFMLAALPAHLRPFTGMLHRPGRCGKCSGHCMIGMTRKGGRKNPTSQMTMMSPHQWILPQACN
jgi:hypothetical protein